MPKLKVALVQQGLREDRDANIAASVASIRERRRARGATGGAAGAAHRELLLPDRGHRLLRPRRDRSPALPPSSSARWRASSAWCWSPRSSSGARPGSTTTPPWCWKATASIAGKYRKMHIPDDPAFYEKFYFTPGDLGFEPIQTSVGRLGVLVCWDQWYPEAARLMALAGAEMLIYPTAIGWDPRDEQAEQQRQLDAWVTVQRCHAVANGIPVLAANRVGFEADPSGAGAGIRFWGSSFVAGPQGEMLARGGEDEELLMVELDRGRSEDVRRIWPFLRDRRIDAYGEILRRYRD